MMWRVESSPSTNRTLRTVQGSRLSNPSSDGSLSSPTAAAAAACPPSISMLVAAASPILALSPFPLVSFSVLDATCNYLKNISSPQINSSRRTKGEYVVRETNDFIGNRLRTDLRVSKSTVESAKYLALLSVSANLKTHQDLDGEKMHVRAPPDPEDLMVRGSQSDVED